MKCAGSKETHWLQSRSRWWKHWRKSKRRGRTSAAWLGRKNKHQSLSPKTGATPCAFSTPFIPAMEAPHEAPAPIGSIRSRRTTSCRATPSSAAAHARCWCQSLASKPVAGDCRSRRSREKHRMMSLSDSELTAVMTAAAPLHPRERDAFLRDVVAELAKYPEIGP